MRRVGAWMTAAVLVGGLAVAGAAGQDADGDLHSAAPKPKAWWDGWFTPAAKPDKPEAKKPEPAVAPAPAAPPAGEPAVSARQRERAAYNRRMEALDRLAEIAVQNNDADMQTQIDQLRDRAWELYQRRSGTAQASAPMTPDEAALEKPRRSTPLPLKPKADGGEASVIREVMP